MDIVDRPYLKNLNEAQLNAVTHLPSIPLQILAGPGSGKTRVLTARVAHLVKEHNIPPNRICAVTFTNKAANEMQTRLRPLIGEETTNKLVMGTFHAICVRYLRRHGKKIGLENNFSICDADESKKIVLKIILTHIEAKEIIDIKDSVIRSMISTAKSKAQTPAQLRQESKRPGGDQQKLVVAEIYEEYEEALRQNNSLDFDDLLVYGVRLFDKAPAVLKDIEHILVDEFQDTSVLQYELVKQFAKASGCVTIVGDPDQSIYGWRAAEIENLGKMMKDFPTTAQIFLEENYRSTASILAVSHAIVSQDKQRIAKSLYTSHASGSTPVLRLTANEHEEADFISGEIKRLMAYSGGMLDYNDFAILLRYNALSRPIEASFQREGIPVRMLAGQKFFERAEIKDILAYLQLVDNPSFNPAFHRVVNVPARAIGDKSVQDLENLAKTKGWSSLYAAERICQGKIAASDCKSVTRLKKQLPAFVAVIRKLKDLAQKGTSVPDLIMRLVELIKYEEHLQKIYPHWESRWENVQELIKFAHEISSSTPEPSASQPTPTIKPASQLVLTDDGDFVEVKEESADSKEVANEVTDDTPLRKFLQASSLSTDTEASEQEADANGPKVTVSTCHAAKGLEWPVVFIPSVEQGTYPYYRTEDVQEERRLLYVGCTRAQFLLYLTHAKIRLEMGAPCKKKNLSQLITPVLKTNMSLFSSQKLPSMDTIERKILGQLLGRPVSSNHQVTEAVSQHRPSHRIQEAYHVWSHGDKPTFRSSDRRWNEDNRKPCSADGEGEGPSRARPEWTYPAFSGAAKPATAPFPLQSFSTAQSLHNASYNSKVPTVTETPPTIPVNILPAKSIKLENSGTGSKSGSIASYVTKPSAPLTGPKNPPSKIVSLLGPGLPPSYSTNNSLQAVQSLPGSGMKSINIIKKEDISAGPIKLAGGKRRLGMGRVPDGFGLGGQSLAKKARQE